MYVYSILFVSAFFHLFLTPSNSCSTIGSSDILALTRTTENNLFLNFEAPAQCRGNVTGWGFCYYENTINGTIDSSDRIEAVFIVYRRVSNTDLQFHNNYVDVPRSVREISIPLTTVQGSEFTCTSITLTSNEYFEIQENDIVGACIRRTGSVYPLLLVGTTNSSNIRTYKVDRVAGQFCTASKYELVDTSESSFELRRSSTLHLSANVEVAAICSAGNNPSASNTLMAIFRSGTFLNTKYPVTCGNYVTKWNYCYYTEAATPGSTLSMTVAVWSLDTNTYTYIVHPNSIRMITIQSVQTLAKVFCAEESLSESDYVQVSPGDVIGVMLPSNNAIPIIGFSQSTSVSIKRNPNSENLASLVLSDLSELPGTLLHLRSTIDTLNITVSSSVSTNPHSTSESKLIITTNSLITELPTSSGSHLTIPIASSLAVVTVLSVALMAIPLIVLCIRINKLQGSKATANNVPSPSNAISDSREVDLMKNGCYRVNNNIPMATNICYTTKPEQQNFSEDYEYIN